VFGLSHPDGKKKILGIVRNSLWVKKLPKEKNCAKTNPFNHSTRRHSNTGHFPRWRNHSQNGRHENVPAAFRLMPTYPVGCKITNPGM